MSTKLSKPRLAALLLMLAARGAFAAGADEASLRAAVDRATWPADIVSAADAYLRAFPQAAAAPAIAADRESAARCAQLLGRSDLHLYRSAFGVRSGEDATALHRAALGDVAAAVELAHRNRELARGRYEGWLQYAALLGDERASYELALHYRASDQPLLAARYEAIAVAHGWQPPPALDNQRK